MKPESEPESALPSYMIAVGGAIMSAALGVLLSAYGAGALLGYFFLGMGVLFIGFLLEVVQRHRRALRADGSLRQGQSNERLEVERGTTQAEGPILREPVVEEARE